MRLMFRGLRGELVLLLRRGAEAELHLQKMFGKTVILKKRIKKRYRIDVLDEQIRNYRTVHEALMMHKAKECGVPTPTIYLIDLAEKTIVMEHIEGQRLKDIMETAGSKDINELCYEVGRLIGHMHKNDLIHGDLTTSNILITKGENIFFIDFGLSEISNEIEKKGVDLHLMKRALQSSHYKLFEESYENILKGYSEVVGEGLAKEVLSKIEEIEKRGRYISKR